MTRHTHYYDIDAGMTVIDGQDFYKKMKQVFKPVWPLIKQMPNMHPHQLDLDGPLSHCLGAAYGAYAGYLSQKDLRKYSKEIHYIMARDIPDAARLTMNQREDGYDDTQDRRTLYNDLKHTTK